MNIIFSLLLPLLVTETPLDSVSFGVGGEYISGTAPVSKGSFFFGFSFGYGIIPHLETNTIVDFGLPAVGKNAENKDIRMFLGRAYQTLRPFFSFGKDEVRLGLDMGGGVYLTRHRQPRLASPGVSYGGIWAVGPVMTYFPLKTVKYRWSDMFIQLRMNYIHFPTSDIVDRDFATMLCFGGSF